MSEIASAMETFLADIEKIVGGGSSYMEAVILWCEQKGLDPEYAGSLVRRNRTLKAKIESEAAALRCLKTRGLPV